MIQHRLRQVDLLSLYRRASRAERDAAKRAQFARLKARFEPNGMSPPVPMHSHGFPIPRRGIARAARGPAPGQLALAIG